MNILSTLTSNYLINVSFLAWAIAQILKTVFTYLGTNEFVLERLVGSGGMPSSHSSTVCALTVGMARKLGFASPLFALTVVLAAVVMYDAMGVRRAAGEQAKILNILFYHFKQRGEGEADECLDGRPTKEQIREAFQSEKSKMLKEFLGHTPMEVLAGALLGILVAMIVPVK